MTKHHKFKFFHWQYQQLIVHLVDEKIESKYNYLIIFSKVDQFFKDNINKLFLINRLLIDLLSSNLKDSDNNHLLIREHQVLFKVKI